MKTKTTLILLIIAVALGLFIFVVERKMPTTEERERLVKKLFRVEADQISRIELKWDQEEIICHKEPEGDEWVMTVPFQTKADVSAIEQVLQELELVEKKGVPIKAEPDKPLNLASFGLVTPTLVVSFTIDEEDITHQFKIGNETTMGNARYLIIEGKNEVYLVDKSFYATLNKSVFDLRHKKVIGLEAGQINRIQFVRPDELIELTKLTGNEWRVTKPITDKAASDKIRDILSTLEELSAQAFVADNESELTKYGLDQPGLEITVATPSQQETILWGNALPDDPTKVHVTKRDSNTILSLDSLFFNKLNVDLKDLRDKKLFNLSFKKITRIELKYSDKERILIQKEGNTWQMLEPTDADFDASTLYGFVSKFNATTIEEFIADSPTDLALYGLVSPAIEALFTFPASPAGGSEKESRLSVALSPFTDSSYTYLRRTDEDRVVAVENDLYDTLKKGTLIFRRRNLLNIPRRKITRCTIEKEGVKTIFEQEEPGIWNVIAPEKAKVKRTGKLYEILDAVCYLTTNEFVAKDQADSTAYGLDKPTYRINIEYQKDDKPEQEVILIGKRTEKGSYYGMIEGQPFIFVISPDLVTKIKEDLHRKND